MDEAASSEKRRYGLFVRRSGGIALKHGDEGVGLHDGLLFWSSQKGEVARPLRFVNIGFGAWLMISPWVIDGYAFGAAGASLLLGAALIVLAYPPGHFASHFGAWDKIARSTPRFRRMAHERVLPGSAFDGPPV